MLETRGGEASRERMLGSQLPLHGVLRRERSQALMVTLAPESSAWTSGARPQAGGQRLVLTSRRGPVPPGSAVGAEGRIFLSFITLTVPPLGNRVALLIL